MKLPRLIAAACLLAGGPALAGQSAWHDTIGGSMRIVTDDVTRGDGILRGVLQIRLAEGWKTYWRDPGATGIAPAILPGASTDVAAVDIRFPAPVRIHDQDTVWAGYDRDVDLALEFHVGDAPRIAIDLFAGLCAMVCVPVQAQFTVPPVSEAGDAAIVEQAFAALPGAADARFGVSRMVLAGDQLLADIALPDTAEGAELFLASPEGWEIGIPIARYDAGGRLRFSAAVLRKPSAVDGLAIGYTLVQGNKAVSGTAAVQKRSRAIPDQVETLGRRTLHKNK